VLSKAKHGSLCASLFIDLLVVLLACHTASPLPLLSCERRGGALNEGRQLSVGRFLSFPNQRETPRSPKLRPADKSAATTLSNHEDARKLDGGVSPPTRPPHASLSEICFFDTELTACTGITHEGLLPSAFCVQRFSNGMVLQYIPLIALCCVLHRYGKPSHPSRHVLDATQDPCVKRGLPS
jgi:hypothetical protein